MNSWIKAFVLFALLVAVPFAVEEFFGPHPQMSFGSLNSRKDCLSDCLKGDCEKLCVKPDKSAGPSWWRDWWHDLVSYSPAAIISLVVIIFLVVLALNIPKTYQISEYLTLAERDMNALLRGWGGGYGNRKDVVKERAEWLTMIPECCEGPIAEVYKQFFELNQTDLSSGGAQGGSMGKARFTAYLLREIYEGNVRNAQIKILNELKSGGKPHIAAGIREIVGYDDIVKHMKLPEKYIGYFPMILTVKLHHHPKHIIMVRTDKTVAENWDVLRELNNQVRPVKA